MIIQNKKTLVEYPVSADEWKKIQVNPILANKFKVVDTSDIKKAVSAPSDRKKIIIPEEIINYKKNLVNSIKKEEEEKMKLADETAIEKTEIKKTTTKKQTKK